MALDKIVDSALLDAEMTSVADAIRAKAGTTDPLLWPDGFKTAIEAISGGGRALIIGTENLHDISTDTEDKYLTPSGVETLYSGWSITDYIELKSEKTYAIRCTKASIRAEYCCLYNSSKKFIKNIGVGGFYSTDYGLVLFTAGIDGYIRFSGDKGVIKVLIMTECVGGFEYATETADTDNTEALSDDIPAEVALDILTGGGPEE